VVWPVIFAILAALFGVMGYTGAAYGWVLLAKALFTVTVLAFGMPCLSAIWWSRKSPDLGRP
jgi:uncharacterized membrane protein YtjA (UPF0391 family)